jgi:DNA polymerase III subunit delta'
LKVQFSSVIGQQHLKNLLIQEVQSGKISHAQLFYGEPGYGALPLALGFIQYLFCENKRNDDSCGECHACKKVQDLQHPDLHFSFPVVQSIGKTSDVFISDWRKQVLDNPYFDLFEWTNRIDSKGRKPIISVEESKEILRKLSLKSFEGGFKVMLIWLADEMNDQCSNKLLKILEEPPSNTLFILVAESPEKLLVTIQSRTQKILVPRIDLDDLSSFLRSNFSKNSAQADSISAFSEGNFIKAKELAEENDLKQLHRERFIQLMRVCYKKDVIQMLAWAEEVSQDGKETQKLFIQYALHMFRQSLLQNYMGEEMIRASSEEKVFLKNFAPFITGKNIREFISLLDDTYYHLDRNANTKIMFTQLCFQTMRYIHLG